jgi:hypothetical protein
VAAGLPPPTIRCEWLTEHNPSFCRRYGERALMRVTVGVDPTVLTGAEITSSDSMPMVRRGAAWGHHSQRAGILPAPGHRADIAAYGGSMPRTDRRQPELVAWRTVAAMIVRTWPWKWRHGPRLSRRSPAGFATRRLQIVGRSAEGG